MWMQSADISRTVHCERNFKCATFCAGQSALVAGRNPLFLYPILYPLVVTTTPYRASSSRFNSSPHFMHENELDGFSPADFRNDSMPI